LSKNKSYFHYIIHTLVEAWNDLVEAWNEDHNNILMPIWFFTLVAVPVSIWIYSVMFQYVAGLLIGFASFWVIFPLPWIPDWIREKINNYNKWKAVN